MYIGIEPPVLNYSQEQILSYKKEILTESQEAGEKPQQDQGTCPLLLPQAAQGSWINTGIFYSHFATVWGRGWGARFCQAMENIPLKEALASQAPTNSSPVLLVDLLENSRGWKCPLQLLH